MKKLFLTYIILVFTTTASLYAEIIHSAFSNKLEYHLSWDGKSTILKVSLEYIPVTKDSTVFIYGTDSFGGQKDIFKVVQNIKCDPSDSIKITPKERKITVFHRSDQEPKRINYEINGQLVNNSKRAIYDELFRPVITGNSLYMVSCFFMMNPTKYRASSFSVQWDSFPEQIPYFISTAPETSPFKKQTIPLSKKEEILIVTGADLLINKYDVRGIPYYSITSKRDTINNLSLELEPFFKRYFPDIRDFWKDNHAAYYYVCALPLFTPIKSMPGGFGCGPGFMMKYNGKFDDWNRKVIAHETAHTWIGLSMIIGKSNFEHQWFNEGFNDYVMFLNLIKSGIIDQAGFLQYLNKDMFFKHYNSPVKNAANDSIGPNYWKDNNYEKLPYRRGFIYAFYLDNQIRVASNGTQSIRDLLLALLKKSREIKSKDADDNLSLTDFITIANGFLPGAPIEKEIDSYIIKGNLIDFKNINLVKVFKIDYQDEVPVLAISKNSDLQKTFSW